MNKYVLCIKNTFASVVLQSVLAILTICKNLTVVLMNKYVLCIKSTFASVVLQSLLAILTIVCKHY